MRAGVGGEVAGRGERREEQGVYGAGVCRSKKGLVARGLDVAQAAGLGADAFRVPANFV